MQDIYKSTKRIITSLLILISLSPTVRGLDLITLNNNKKINCKIIHQTIQQVVYFENNLRVILFKQFIQSIQLDVDVDKYFKVAEVTENTDKKIKYLKLSIKNFPGEDYNRLTLASLLIRIKKISEARNFYLKIKNKSVPFDEYVLNQQSQYQQSKKRIKIKALLNRNATLKISKEGIRWKNNFGQKPGYHKGKWEPTFIDKQKWLPKWENEGLEKQEHSQHYSIIFSNAEERYLMVDIISLSGKLISKKFIPFKNFDYFYKEGELNINLLLNNDYLGQWVELEIYSAKDQYLKLRERMDLWKKGIGNEDNGLPRPIHDWSPSLKVSELFNPGEKSLFNHKSKFIFKDNCLYLRMNIKNKTAIVENFNQVDLNQDYALAVKFANASTMDEVKMGLTFEAESQNTFNHILFSNKNELMIEHFIDFKQRKKKKYKISNIDFNPRKMNILILEKHHDNYTVYLNGKSIHQFTSTYHFGNKFGPGASGVANIAYDWFKVYQ